MTYIEKKKSLIREVYEINFNKPYEEKYYDNYTPSFSFNASSIYDINEQIKLGNYKIISENEFFEIRRRYKELMENDKIMNLVKKIKEKFKEYEDYIIGYDLYQQTVQIIPFKYDILELIGIDNIKYYGLTKPNTNTLKGIIALNKDTVLGYDENKISNCFTILYITDCNIKLFYKTIVRNKFIKDKLYQIQNLFKYNINWCQMKYKKEY